MTISAIFSSLYPSVDIPAAPPKPTISSPISNSLGNVRNCHVEIGHGKNGTAFKILVSPRLTAQLQKVSYSGELNERIRSDAVVKQLNISHNLFAVHVLDRERRMLEGLDHPNIIKTISGQLDDLMLFMQDGGPSLAEINIASIYQKFYDFLNKTIGIDCKSYTLDLSTENFYKSILGVYQGLCEQHGKCNVDIDLLLEECQLKYPYIDVDAILKSHGFTNDFDLTNDGCSFELESLCRNYGCNYNLDIRSLVTSYLGVPASEKLGESFTLENFLLSAKNSAQGFDLPLGCCADNLFSYFKEGETSLTQSLLQFAINTKCDFAIEKQNDIVASLLSRHKLNEPHGFNLGEELFIMYQVSQAVGYLHTKGIAHNDLHDGNIVLDKHGCARLIDFGSALTCSRLTTEAELREGMKSDVEYLRVKMNDIFIRKFKEFTSPDVLNSCMKLINTFQTAEELQTGLARFRWLFPKWSGTAD